MRSIAETNSTLAEMSFDKLKKKDAFVKAVADVKRYEADLYALSIFMMRIKGELVRLQRHEINLSMAFVGKL